MMDNTAVNQSFNVDDIRRLRDEADKRYANMPFDQVVREISEGAKEGQQIIDRIRREREKQHGA